MQYASRYAVGTESSEVIVEAAYSSCRERETNARNAFLAEVQGRGVNTYQAQSAWSGTIEPARNAARQDAFNVIVQLRAKRPPTCL